MRRFYVFWTYAGGVKERLATIEATSADGAQAQLEAAMGAERFLAALPLGVEIFDAAGFWVATPELA